MKKVKLVNKAIILSSALLIASQFTACGSQSILSGPGANKQQVLTLLSDEIDSDGDFNVLAAPKKPAAKPAPKKLPPPPPKPLPKAFMDALKKHPELLPGFAALKGLPPHEHFPKLQALVKDYPDLVKLLPKPPAGAPPAPPSGAPSGPPPEGMQAPPPGGDGGMKPPHPEGGPSCSPPPEAPPVAATPSPEVSPEATPTPEPSPETTPSPVEGVY